MNDEEIQAALDRGERPSATPDERAYARVFDWLGASEGRLETGFRYRVIRRIVSERVRQRTQVAFLIAIGLASSGLVAALLLSSGLAATGFTEGLALPGVSTLVNAPLPFAVLFGGLALMLVDRWLFLRNT